MKAVQMSAETAGLSLGFKSGLFAAIGTVLVSVLAVVVGFAIVPLDKVRPMVDASRRLAAGLFCSFTLGPLLAFYCLVNYPWMLKPWLDMMPGSPLLLVYFTAAAPFIAVCGLLGFWIVAGVMLWFSKRQGMDAVEMARDLTNQVGANLRR